MYFWQKVPSSILFVFRQGTESKACCFSTTHKKLLRESRQQNLKKALKLEFLSHPRVAESFWTKNVIFEVALPRGFSCIYRVRKPLKRVTCTFWSVQKRLKICEKSDGELWWELSISYLPKSFESTRKVSWWKDPFSTPFFSLSLQICRNGIVIMFEFGWSPSRKCSNWKCQKFKSFPKLVNNSAHFQGKFCKRVDNLMDFWSFDAFFQARFWANYGW